MTTEPPNDSTNAAGSSRRDGSWTTYTDPIMALLPEELQPPSSLVCSHCPASIWVATKKAAVCHCQALHRISWYPGWEPLLQCSYQLIALAKLEEKLD